MSDASEGLDRVRTLLDVFSSRLGRCRGHRLVVTYDGSVQDRILFELLRRNRALLPGCRIDVLCCTRPCMDADLKAEVEDFARQGEFEILAIEGMCDFDEHSYTIRNHRCGEIGDRLKALLEGGALHVVASISQASHVEDMRTALAVLGGGILEEEIDGTCVWTKEGAASRLIFHQFLPRDIFDLHAFLFGQPPKEYQVPICFAPCHYEVEKMKLLRLIRKEGAR